MAPAVLKLTLMIIISNFIKDTFEPFQEADRICVVQLSFSRLPSIKMQELFNTKYQTMNHVQFLTVITTLNVLILIHVNPFITDFTLFMWLSKLKAIPEAKNPQIMRITSWLTRQSNNKAYHIIYLHIYLYIPNLAPKI